MRQPVRIAHKVRWNPISARDESKRLTEQIGSRLRQIRRDQQLSLEALAEKTGVSKLTLGKIERGEANPTLTLVWKIARGLSIPLSALVGFVDEVDISRAGAGPTLADTSGRWVVEPMFRTGKYGFSETHRATLLPHTDYTVSHHPGTIEMVTVMAGSIDMVVQGVKHTLHTFDAIRFQADGEHTYINAGDTEAVLHLIVNCPHTDIS